MASLTNGRIKFTFPNRHGQQLAALLELPLTQPVAYALFAHCFTCSKDIAAATRISRALARQGFGVLRFDFTGLGSSEGDFSNTNFSSNVDDLVCAADHLRQQYGAPSLLIGHSLGGAAILAAAGKIPESSSVVTIGAPCDPDHVSGLFGDKISAIEADGEAVVDLQGRRFTLKKQFLDDIAERRLGPEIHNLGKALLVFHSPVDAIVSIDNARKIFDAARHPKSFISLDKADHLLSRREDSEYVAQTMAAWASRYVLDGRETDTQPAVNPGRVVVRETGVPYVQKIRTPHHEWLSDEPQTLGGRDAGPSPYEMLLGALGACTAITLRMYAVHKKIPLDSVEVELKHERAHGEDCSDCTDAGRRMESISRLIRLQGSLTAAQRQRLFEIAERCPVHRTLSSQVTITTDAQ